jgi:hypothetical protein
MIRMFATPPFSTLMVTVPAVHALQPAPAEVTP